MSGNTDLIKEKSSFTLIASQQDHGQRVDKFITSHFSQYSRSFLQKLFNQKSIILNNQKPAKPGNALKTGDTIHIAFPEQNQPQQLKEIPHDIGVTIVAQEQDFLIINKPAGLVVHPPNDTFQEAALTDWIIKHRTEIAHVGTVDRPGIVHRLDRETSGLMIIARTNAAHATFTQMFKDRKIHKTYLALISGHPDQDGTIDYYVGRHPAVRHKMTHFTELTRQASSRQATTHFQAIKYFDHYSLIEAKPVTGRTHQIRVHFAAIGHPLLADQLYGTSSKLIKRHALHAHKLEFEFNDKQYSFTSPLEQDMKKLVS